MDLLTRIPKHLHFLFYDFSTIYYEFWKFQPFFSKRLFAALFIWAYSCADSPWTCSNCCPRSLVAYRVGNGLEKQRFRRRGGLPAAREEWRSMREARATWWCARSGSEVIGEAPTVGAVRGGARRGVQRCSGEGGRRWVGRWASASRERPIPRVGLGGREPGKGARRAGGLGGGGGFCSGKLVAGVAVWQFGEVP